MLKAMYQAMCIGAIEREIKALDIYIYIIIILYIQSIYIYSTVDMLANVVAAAGSC